MRDVEEPTSGAREPGDDEPGLTPEVTTVLEGDTARITLTGELTPAARRPLVRTLTDLLLATPTLRRVELELAGVGFMNSGGMAVLVQLQRLGQPRDVPIVLVDPTPAVVRPLQLSGLWHRFPIEERTTDGGEQ
jgi:stage II sporulation protein AA (anti-sigma F factor antagonist)